MSTRWKVRGLVFSAGFSVLIFGCNPPNIMNSAPPGIDPRLEFAPKDVDPAEALGEVVVAKGPKAKVQSATEVPLALPTKIGETKTTPAGVVYETLTEGDGATAQPGDTIKIHYTGTLESGLQFDSSRGKRAYTVAIGTGAVIKGWDQGIPGMKVGERRKLTIPPQAGYGAQGYAPDIPPNATLLFDLELMEIVTAH